MEENVTKNNRNILVKKASGDEEIFLSHKLARSLLNAGADNEIVEKIVADIERWITPGITTKEIYARAFSLLSADKINSSFRYRLKQAILELGSTGYPFEILIGKLFEHMGYETEVGVVINGQCVTHEIDVIATNKETQHFVECKYHKDQGKPVSIQVPLYVRSRVDDIIKTRKVMSEYKNLSFQGWVITNTRLSSDTIQYSTCSGLKLLAWNYPTGNGLKENIEKFKLYPITILKNLSMEEKELLMKKGMVTCLQLRANTDSLIELNLKKTKYHALLKEMNEICM